MRKHPKHRSHTNPNYHIKPLTPDRLERILYGESLPDKHIKERLQETRKEIMMPSLQDALQIAMQKQQQDNAALHATINEWAQDEKPQPEPKEKTMPNPQPTYNVAHVTPSKVRFVPTVGVSEAVFNYVRDNPGKSRMEISKTLVSQGFKKSSVSSLIGQYLRTDYFFKDSEGGYRTAFNDYTPLPSTKAQIRYTQAKKRALSKPAPKTITLVTKKAKPETAGIAALKADTTDKALPLPLSLPVNKFEPGALIDSLSVMQARELYDMLKRIFGG